MREDATGSAVVCVANVSRTVADPGGYGGDEATLKSVAGRSDDGIYPACDKRFGELLTFGDAGETGSAGSSILRARFDPTRGLAAPFRRKRARGLAQLARPRRVGRPRDACAPGIRFIPLRHTYGTYTYGAPPTVSPRKTGENSSSRGG